MAPPEPDLERARALIALAPWKFAKTYADDAPHSYAVRAKYVAAGGSHDEFNWLVQHIRDAGWNGRWRHMRGRYLTVDEHQYWTMGWPVEQTLILNRADRRDPRSRAIPCGELRPCAAMTKKGEPCCNMAEFPRRLCPIHNRYPHLSEPELVRQLELFSQDWWEKDDQEDENTMTTFAVIYAAKSTEDKHGSIPTQLEDCRALAERHGWESSA